jgi:hypothetical protein
LPGDGEYDRHEREEFAGDLRLWLIGCGVVVLFTLIAFVVYAILLFHSGWKG